MDKSENNWRSVSTTVSREVYDDLVRVASGQGIKLGTLVRKALRAYTSAEVLSAASALDVDVEALMKQSAVLFMRVANGKDERSLRDQVIRLTLWIEKLFFVACQRNERLMMQERQDIENRIKALYKALAEDDVPPVFKPQT